MSEIIDVQTGKYILISQNDYISRKLKSTGSWAPNIQEVANKLCSTVDSPLVIDIGANLGGFSVPVAKHLQGLGGKLIAYEPQPMVYYQLCGNIALNNLTNVTAINSAVGSYDGLVEIPVILADESENIGAFSISEEYRKIQSQPNQYTDEKVSVPILMLDSIHVEQAPAFIKIDVEGLEYDVIQHGARFLKKHGYPPMVFEVWEREWFKQQKEKLMALVTGLGYKVTNLGSGDYLAEYINK